MDLANKPTLSRENSLGIQKKPFVPSASTARIISSIRTAAKAIKFIEFSKSGENGSLNIFKAFKPLKGKHGRPSVVESHHLEEPVDINNTEHEKLVVDILQVKPENRYEEELSFLRKAFKDIEVFQQLECDMDSSSFAKVFRALRLQTAKAGEKVINFGDFGKTYYMIIKGSVSVVLKSEKMGEKRRDNKNISSKKANEKDKMNEYVAAFLREEEQKQNKANKDGSGSTSAFWFVKNLNQGQAFGELALSKGSNRKRTATVICKEDCIFAILTYNDYYTLLGDIYERRIVENMSLLQSVDIFESWKDYEISFFASSLNEAKYTRNQILFRQGENPDFVYFIKSGEVELKKNICREKGAETNFKHWKKNDSIRLAMLMKGGYFGEGEVITADTREYTASIYSSDARLLYMDREQFLNFCRGKRRFETLQKAILERKLARQELISKLIGSRDQLTETISSQNIKFQQYFSSDPIPGFYQSLSPFQKHLLAGDASPTKTNPNHLPEVTGSNQSSRSSSLENSSPRRYEKAKPKGPVSKIFSTTFLNQTQKNEKKPRTRGESPTASRVGSKLLDRSSFLNTQTSIFSPRDEVDPVMTKIQSAPDPYSIFKLSKIYHTETPKNVPSVPTLDMSPKNNKQKDKTPMIKLIKSLGLDRIYEEIGSQTERAGSKTYFNLQSLQPIPETENLKKPPSIDFSNPDKYQLPSTLSALDNSPRRHESVKTRSVSPKMIQKIQKSFPKKFSLVAIAANENPYS